MNYFDAAGTLLFYSKDEATGFNTHAENTGEFNSHKHKAKLIGNTEAHGTYRIFRNSTITVSLKYLSNFRRSPKCYWLISKLNWNLDGQIIVFYKCLVFLIVLQCRCYFYYQGQKIICSCRHFISKRWPETF